ncbi:integral membrane protein [Streptomyces sp. SPB78]|uniref:EI24 domain-containing protein n=1 Tax=Streptomyces sp. (strain SPB78) TaxID=591157 RepID=UPI0001B553A0|nr:EI24 domain-containing protein [Streptomyces sp. SPB78]EFK99524.1 integral membrane protein [Streptomyces sp. SPB78]
MRELALGFRYLLEGQRWVGRHGKRYGVALLPGLITLVLYAAVLVALALWGGDLVAWATPFADDWESPWQGLFRGALTVVLFALVLLGCVLSFTAVTLVVGQPFYDALSEEVDREIDGFPTESGLSLGREIWISVRDGVRVLVRAAIWGVCLFAAGFLPFVGQTVVPVIGFFVTGFFLAEELASIALARRRVDLRERLALLRGRKQLTWGFGVPLGLAFLVPVVAVFLMPGAVAGATLLARDLRGEPLEAAPREESPAVEPH